MAQEEARPKRARKKKEQNEADKAPKAASRAEKVTRPRSRKPVSESPTVYSPSTEAVAVHAYLLWESGEPGDATEHWLRAERELAAA